MPFRVVLSTTSFGAFQTIYIIICFIVQLLLKLYLYEVAITERQYRGSTVGEVVSRYYGNSYASLVSQFVEEKKLDVDELKALIEQIENQK